MLAYHFWGLMGNIYRKCQGDGLWKKKKDRYRESIYRAGIGDLEKEKPRGHLGLIQNMELSADGCEDCLGIGDEWVNLHMCLIGRHVGNCDNSREKCHPLALYLVDKCMPPEMDSLTRCDFQVTIEARLDQAGLENSWELMPALVDLTLRVTELEVIRKIFAEEKLQTVLEWLCSEQAVFSMITGIGFGAERMSGFV